MLLALVRMLALATTADACTGSSAGLNATDCLAWVDLFDATSGAHWANCGSSRLDPCGCTVYDSVRCSGNRITYLNLVLNRLVGSIPASIAELKMLTLIDLSENKISGSIPAGLSELKLLTGLSLAHNKLTGSIPAEISELPQLTWLSLYSNALTGTIPPGLAGLSQVTDLNLGNNLLTGVVPALPFAQYTGSTSYCCLQGAGTNRFACPLPAGVETCIGDAGSCETTCK
jgi:Leucine-rich repeat (LRR) protein